MFKKVFNTCIASSFLLGLAACNANDTNRAFDPVDNSRGYRVQNNLRDNDPNLRDNDLYEKGRNLNISASNTNMSSNQYPHTRAVLIQDAQYKFVRVDPKQAQELQARLQQQLGQLTQQGQFSQGPTNVKPVPAPTPVPAQPAPAPTQPVPAPTPTQPKQQAPAGISQYAQQVINLTNNERSKAGLPALKADPQLSGVATKKSQDMAQNNYFSHTSPTYGSPFDMMRDFGVTYRAAGENIAQGQRTPQEVVNSWMNSPGHKANILGKQFTHIGVGFEQNGNHWTQMFISK